MSTPIEKYAFIKPMPGQGKRVMKSKLLTALGATGVLRPYVANTERDIERKILLQNPFNANPTPVTPPVVSNGLLNSLVHFYRVQEAAANFADSIAGGTNTPLGWTNGGQDFTQVAGHVEPFAGNYSGNPGFDMIGTLGSAAPNDFGGGNAQTTALTFAIWVKPNSVQPNSARTPIYIGTWDNDTAPGQESWVVAMKTTTTNFDSLQLFSRDSATSLFFTPVTAGIIVNSWNLIMGGWDSGLQKVWLSINDGARSLGPAQTSLQNTAGGAEFNINNLFPTQRGVNMAFESCGIWNRNFTQSDQDNVWNNGNGLLFSKFTT